MTARYITVVAACALSLSQLATAQVPPTPPAAAPQGGRGGGRGAQDTLVSPEVHPDRTVTFRIRAPQATTVTLTGDWLATPQSPTGGPMTLTKDTAGVWSGTPPPLEATRASLLLHA